jgi:hypothetical protein
VWNAERILQFGANFSDQYINLWKIWNLYSYKRLCHDVNNNYLCSKLPFKITDDSFVPQSNKPLYKFVKDPWFLLLVMFGSLGILFVFKSLYSMGLVCSFLMSHRSFHSSSECISPFVLWMSLRRYCFCFCTRSHVEVWEKLECYKILD